VPTLTVNGAAHPIEDDASLLDLVAQTIDRPLTADGTPADGGRLGVAVALDSAVVPRSRWQDTRLADGQTVEIITAMQGG
jgi:sulfur carrier protein